jgi:arginase
VRFWGESPLVREPDVLLFGLDRVDAPEQEFLSKSPLRYVYAADIQKKDAVASARDALAHLHADSRDFVLHVDTDIIAQEEFPAVNVPGSGGLSFEEIRLSLREILSQKTLLGFDVAQYNPDRDPDGSSAQKLVGLLLDGLAARFEALTGPAEPPTSSPAPDVTQSDVTQPGVTQPSADQSVADDSNS